MSVTGKGKGDISTVGRSVSESDNIESALILGSQIPSLYTSD